MFPHFLFFQILCSFCVVPAKWPGFNCPDFTFSWNLNFIFLVLTTDCTWLYVQIFLLRSSVCYWQDIASNISVKSWILYGSSSEDDSRFNRNRYEISVHRPQLASQLGLPVSMCEKLCSNWKELYLVWDFLQAADMIEILTTGWCVICSCCIFIIKMHH
jgi:hypothetical protein